ncbi:hypothetical protein SH2C18_11050 [Clostridium sediminicola]|uniref:MEDS domain-containing protein n=1 Tax=Clostridium sediminicola TaxID=3114879 RepID=UPI0031F26B74
MKSKYDFGKSLAFYYASEEHLLINLYYYIKNAHNQNEKVLICVEADLANKLSRFIEETLDANFEIETFDYPNTVNRGYNSSVIGIKNELIEYVNRMKSQGYEGVRIIEQATFTLKSINESRYIQHLKDTPDILHGIDCSILSLYDFWDYLNEQKYITENIIMCSRKEHEFLLTNFEITEMNKHEHEINIVVT